MSIFDILGRVISSTIKEITENIIGPILLAITGFLIRLI